MTGDSLPRGIHQPATSTFLVCFPPAGVNPRPRRDKTPARIRVHEEGGGETCFLNGMVEGKKESKMPKHQVTLRQTLCEPLSVTNDDGEGAQKLGERQSQDGGFQVSFSMFPQVLVS